MSTDYRDSHTSPGYGEEYQKLFAENPYRSMMWSIEKSFLHDIYLRYLSGLEFDHLDFACGTGRILEYYSRYACRSVGFDLSASMLDVARSICTNVELIQGDITRDELLNGRMFDLVTAFRFFPNAQPELRLEAIQALVKHLQPDGYFVFNNHKNSTSTRLRVARLLGRKNIHAMRQQEVESLLVKADLKVVRTYHAGFFPSSEHRQILSPGVLAQIEHFASKVGFLRAWSENILYVCVKC